MLRLFLSVDMVGSTEFKARFTGQGSEGWLGIFQTFFTSFPLMAAGQVGLEFLDDDRTPAIDVWKVMGDEVVFVTTPSSAEELTSILIALLRTMQLYEERHFQQLPLRLKGTAWLAGFDGQNIEIEIPELSSGAGAHLDFIGPDIDLGFRISKFARPGSLVISLDVLETVLGARNAARAALYLMGKEPLKGVMFGRPYPIVWMLEAGQSFAFLPWEVEQDALMAMAATQKPASEAELGRTIEDMRHYLRKMHGRERRPVKLGG
ncbi:MAG: hypothetical protein EPO51_05450 [Phenylobacterium sp.]|uniref:hypothetical protein n=1 Tax=Phenylobacterium sp. TaxID=1871053 RepID=UPI0011F95CDB|nr:hypothetical protein [Phenylobacterium sp.]TAJ73443.1 MAG: hypothetical protein EPO51_05450 [Phenylobacterium sp.]